MFVAFAVDHVLDSETSMGARKANVFRKISAEKLEARQLTASVSVSATPTLPPQESTASVEVSDAGELRSAEIRFDYDPQKVQIQKDDIRPGSAWNNQAALIANVDEEAGSVHAFIFSTRPINAQTGNLIDVDLDPAPESLCSPELELDLRSVRLNEGEILLKDDPTDGPDPTDHSVNSGKLHARPIGRRLPAGESVAEPELLPSTLNSIASTEAAGQPLAFPVDHRPFFGPIHPDLPPPAHVDLILTEEFLSQ